jgi:hypothetical protein
MTTTDTQRGADGAGRVYSLMVCRVCGADSLDEVCPECRQPFSSPYGNGCAICDGFGGMTANGTWTICPNCSKWDMGGQHYRNINNRSVIMVDPEKFVAGVRRIRDLTEQRDALVAALEERDNTAADLIVKNRALLAALSALLGVPERNVEAMSQRGEENAKQFLKTLRGAGLEHT